MTKDNLTKFQKRAIASGRAFQQAATMAQTLSDRMGRYHFATIDALEVAQELEDRFLRHLDAFRKAKAEYDNMAAFGLKV